MDSYGFILAFINGENPALLLDSSVSCYVAGGGMRSSVPAYITVNPTITNNKRCYVSGEAYGGVGAIRFSASEGQSVTIPHTSQYTNLEKFSFNVWVRYRTAADGTRHSFIRKGSRFRISWEPSSNVFGMMAYTGSTERSVSTLTSSVNRWYMLTIIYDGVRIYFYRNNTPVTSFAATGLLDLTTDQWIIGDNSDVDISDMQIWNYALSAQEIQALHITPAITSCVGITVVSNEPEPVSAMKRAVIVSDYSTSNPGVVSSVLPVVIPNNHERGSTECFIVAGGESSVDWDTSIEYDRFTHVTWDTFLNRSGNVGYIEERKIGEVEYPITRTITAPYRVPTRFDPEISHPYQPAFIVAHYDTDITPRDCFVVAPSYLDSDHECFVLGDQTVVEISQPCFISQTSATGEILLYMDAWQAFEYEEFVDCYVAGESDNEVSSLAMHLGGNEFVESDQLLFINVPSDLTEDAECYVVAVPTVEIESERSAYIVATEEVVGDTNAYICAHDFIVDSVDAYIVAIDKEEVALPAYISVANQSRSRARMFVSAPAEMLSSRGAHISAELNEIADLAMYVGGVRGALWTKQVLLNGQDAAQISASKGAFIVGTDASSHKYAFIVSDLVPPLHCAIVSTGQVSTVVDSYIVSE